MTSSTNKGRRDCKLYITLISVYFSDIIKVLLNKRDVTLGRNKLSISYTIHEPTLQLGNCYMKFCFEHTVSSDNQQ